MGAIGRLFIAVTFVVIFFTCSPRIGMTVDAPDVQTGGVDSGPTALMRQAYRDGRYETVIKEFETLNVPGVPDTVKHSAAYLTGLALLRRCGADSGGCDLNEPLRYFEMIPSSHPDYVFARHAMADVYHSKYRNSKYLTEQDAFEPITPIGTTHRNWDSVTAAYRNKDSAVENLKYAVQVKPKNKAQAEAVNRSYLFLCFLDYNNRTAFWRGDLDSLAKDLRKVPSGSGCYTDAQLGLGWVSLTNREYDDALSAGAEVINSTNDLFLQSDAYFLLACASAYKRDYGKAVSLLDTASRKLASYIAPNGSETAVRRNEYNEYEGRLMFSRDIEFVRENIELASVRLSKIAEWHRSDNEIEKPKSATDTRKKDTRKKDTRKKDTRKKDTRKKDKPRKSHKSKHSKSMSFEDAEIVSEHPSEMPIYIVDIDDPNADPISLPGNHFTGRKPLIENGY